MSRKRLPFFLWPETFKKNVTVLGQWISVHIFKLNSSKATFIYRHKHTCKLSVQDSHRFFIISRLRSIKSRYGGERWTAIGHPVGHENGNICGCSMCWTCAACGCRPSRCSWSRRPPPLCWSHEFAHPILIYKASGTAMISLTCFMLGLAARLWHEVKLLLWRKKKYQSWGQVTHQRFELGLMHKAARTLWSVTQSRWLASRHWAWK